MTGEFCGASLFRGFPAFQRPTEAREKERHLRNFEIPGYRRGHNIPEAVERVFSLAGRIFNDLTQHQINRKQNLKIE